jgi:uncharacterized repeat protein (TIGR03803 family)
MRSKKFSFGLNVVLAIFAATVLVTGTSAAAQTEKVLHSFISDGTDGYGPYAELILDASGNVYGMTGRGGGANNGIVFRLTNAGGVWSEQILYSFGRGSDGAIPCCKPIFDAAGNLYGTTSGGGAFGVGAVFELSPNVDGSWTEKVLYDFKYDGKDGAGPSSPLIFDAAGNLYGSTAYGGGAGSCSVPNTGITGCGTIFELTPKAGGAWTEKILHRFGTSSSNPMGVIRDAAGNLYGTTYVGGTCPPVPPGCGSVFELVPKAGGGWTGKVIHYFRANGHDGFEPNFDLILDTKGNLYGTTAVGGTGSCPGGAGCGTVYELSPPAGGGWTEKILHSFSTSSEDGHFPYGGVVLDAAGNLYGTTWVGGTGTCGAGCGTVFELMPKEGGKWAEKILYKFENNGVDGYLPQAGLVLDAAGNLYGTTYYGGANNGGTVFEVTP